MRWISRTKIKPYYIHLYFLTIILNIDLKISIFNLPWYLVKECFIGSVMPRRQKPPASDRMFLRPALDNILIHSHIRFRCNLCKCKYQTCPRYLDKTWFLRLWYNWLLWHVCPALRDIQGHTSLYIQGSVGKKKFKFFRLKRGFVILTKNKVKIELPIQMHSYCGQGVVKHCFGESTHCVFLRQEAVEHGFSSKLFVFKTNKH